MKLPYGKRSGNLICTNDLVIYEFIKDPNYEIRADWSIWTKITKTGKVSVNNIWREAGCTRRGYRHLKYFRKMLQVHRIIYAKFNGALERDLVVHHIDGNSLNNAPENLQLVTQAVNNLYRFRNHGHPAVMGNKVLDWGKVSEIRRLKKLGWTHESIASMFFISKGHVSQIVNNQIWVEGKEYA